MKVSIVIPTYNRRAVIERTLPALLDQTFPAGDYEVVVVVDGSTDGTAAALRGMDPPVSVRVIEQENRGQAAARNAGLKAAMGEIVLFMDDDLFCGRGLVAEHAAAHVDGGSLLVFGPILVEPESPDTPATSRLRRDTDKWLSRLKRDGVRWPDDAIVRPNSSVRREVAVAAGGFDERFFRAYEDREFGCRLWEAGVRFRYCPRAVTRQLFLKSTDELVLFDAPEYAAREVLLCRKCPALRPASEFANFARWAGLKRWAGKIVVRSPFTVEPLLRLAESCARLNPGAAVRLSEIRWRLSFYRSLVDASGGWWDFEHGYLKTLPILMYHRVGPPLRGAHPALTVSPGSFGKQMRWLRRKGYTTIRAADWHAYCTEGKSLPDKPVLLTFDDAYADLSEYALPALKENGFTGIVFVVTGEIGGRNSWDMREGSAEIRCMGKDDIRRWSEEGIEFGAHSRTHPDLTALSSPELEEEVAGSGRDLAEILDGFPLSFAYPSGSYDGRVLRSAGKVFKLAFTCDDDGVNCLGTSPLALRRAMVRPGDSLAGFGMSVKYGFNPSRRVAARVLPFVPFRTRLQDLFRRLRGY